MELVDAERTDEILVALGEQLAARGTRFELVVIGGAALLVLGLATRPTADVDLVALREGDQLLDPRPLPAPLKDARDTVAADFALPENWLNAAPSSLLDFGLPDGFLERVETRTFGRALPSTSLVDWIRSTSSSTRPLITKMLGNTKQTFGV